MIPYMQKIFYLLYLLCLVFALQTTAAEPAATLTWLQTDASPVTLSNVADDSLSADFNDVSDTVDMLSISEVDIDKIIFPAFGYPLHRTTHLTPEHQLPAYHPFFAFSLDRPPQLS